MIRYCVMLADAGRGRIYVAQAADLRGARLEAVYEQVRFQRASVRGGGDEGFARELCRVLEQRFGGARADRLYLAAPPAFLNLLRRHLGPASASRLEGEVCEDLLRCSPREIADRFAASELKAS